MLRSLARAAAWGLAWLALLAGAAGGWLTRTALLAAHRCTFALAALGALSAAAAIAVALRRRAPRQALALAALAALSLVVNGARHVRFGLEKRAVLAAAPERLSAFGPHLVVGVRDLEEAMRLARKGAIGGIYLPRPFTAGKSVETLRAEIARIRGAARVARGLPFLVMADQEGGIVSHLSPPLPLPPKLADLVADLEGRPGGPAALDDAIAAHGREQGRELASLGVDMNLAPVADLRTATVLDLDLFSRIGERAISGDPERVARAAGAYCRGLAQSGVGCTLKHFPGLGRLATDSHFFLGDLPAAPATLLESDWIPFARNAGGVRTAVMVSHVRVPDLDRMRPASLSPAVVEKTLRGELGFQGPVISDDLCMFPISWRRGGVGRAACEAIEAGVDLLLVSYDADLYYEAMAGLMEDCDPSKLRDQLSRSEERLRRFGTRER